MSSSPQFVALRTDFNKRYVAVVTDGSQKNGLEMSSEAEIVVNLKAKFTVEPSTTAGLVHIRSNYNNKYWCSESPSSGLIAAKGVEQVEDKSSWNCTLFRVQFYGQNVSFYHVGSNSDVQVSTVNNQLLLDVNKTSTGNKEIFTPVDLASIVILPKRVTFKSFVNEGYLLGRMVEGYPYNEFSGDDDMEKATNYEIFVTETGDIRVKSLLFGKYWRSTPWIWSDSDDTSADNPDTLFEVFKVDDNVIALRNKGNKKFCKRLTTEGKVSCLNAGATSMEVNTRLIVKEPVISRKVEVQFRVEDARIYNKRPLTAATVTVPNRTTAAHEVVEGVIFTKTHVSTWSKSTSLTLGVKAEFKSGIPFIAEGKIEVGTEISDTIEFGQSTDFSKEVKTEYRVPVPPMTKVTITVLGAEATYDVPFSYIQTDLYATGDRVTTKLDDGIFKGVESYDFTYETIYEPL
ncbi:uncharacterized protein LOC110699051 [Chenopodium quinoa]|uniref:Agglutinin domain-containing protein n=1 Tax=Chenopodium quinoa TaxID=63459 RepID=A0A803MXG3_CHEQI|nr:uncharacterized protein LOC110699051 [Chenopodium quinoa]